MTAENTAAGGELDEDDVGGGRLQPSRSSGTMHQAMCRHHYPPNATSHRSHPPRKASRAASHVQYSLESSGGARADPRWLPPQGEEPGWQVSRLPPPPHDDSWSPSVSERSRPHEDDTPPQRLGHGWDSPRDDDGRGSGEYRDDDDYLKHASATYPVQEWDHVPPRRAQPVLVEVAPGIRAPLRGSDETWQALQDDFYVPGLCWICDETVFVIQDAAFVLCPDCKTVSPVEGDFIDRLAAGVGLGFKYETLVRWQDELMERRRRRW